VVMGDVRAVDLDRRCLVLGAPAKAMRASSSP
jgi:hypothetical protein